MFTVGKFGIFTAIIIAGQIGALGPLVTIRAATAQSAQLAQTGAVADPAVLRIQEALVWTGYYEGPIDGSAGAGTQSAIKRFQRDVGKPDTGSLDDAQAAMLSQRAQTIVQLTGYRSLLDARSGIRSGMPLGFTPHSKGVAGGSDFASSDNQMQIGLRIFRTNRDAAALFSELKNRLETSSTTVYSVGRSTWFVLAGESESRKYYLRYTTGPDVIAGFFSVHDKSLPRETIGPYVAAVTLMSLTMQPFAAALGRDQIPALADIGQLQPAALSGTTPLSQQGQPPAAVPAQPPANDAATLALQRKIIELEAKQRELERQLATKTTDASKSAPLTKADATAKQQPHAKTDPASNPTSRSGTPAKPDTSDSGVSYGTLAVLAAACILLVLFRLRRASPAPPAPGASASTTPIAANPVQETSVATANATLAPQHIDAPKAVPAVVAATAMPATVAAAPAGSGGLNVVLVGGGMICLVFLLALIVSKIASFTGLS
ncbi:MAG: peptidoglycan-binding domain-containing protein [Bradyrhizobium sp.]|uniref:peptidoglycan-binding domain-containing protein n=1 Tax=Bradyrhizobium sp. TaxID=376 RepID=UPI0029BC6B7D|nr:peptidoglycan-binding domain-containing protein [Bradyrhizobium sp.]MDX3972039.1 peptidoglycan-binding domain-containing protein [Bradyrhizobium sp.]